MNLQILQSLIHFQSLWIDLLLFHLRRYSFRSQRLLRFPFCHVYVIWNSFLFFKKFISYCKKFSFKRTLIPFDVNAVKEESEWFAKKKIPLTQRLDRASANSRMTELPRRPRFPQFSLAINQF